MGRNKVVSIGLLLWYVVVSVRIALRLLSRFTDRGRAKLSNVVAVHVKVSSCWANCLFFSGFHVSSFVVLLLPPTRLLPICAGYGPASGAAYSNVSLRSGVDAP